MAKKKTDAQVVAHLKRHAPHILEAEIDFDALVSKVLSADLSSTQTTSAKERKTRRKPYEKADKAN
jgi:hypothetical protein